MGRNGLPSANCSKNRSTKNGITYGVDVNVEYFEVELVGGEKKIQDPDELIQDICVKPISEINKLKMLFEKERDILQN